MKSITTFLEGVMTLAGMQGLFSLKTTHSNPDGKRYCGQSYKKTNRTQPPSKMVGFTSN